DKLMALLKSCEPATFGVGGRDVLDEGYRKASKLDPTRFSTNFHPHDCGILESIQQILLPSTVRGGLELAVGPQAIKAELYKLNIYSGPSGGTLRVKHRGQIIDFDWAKASGGNVIQWAAFYGDCEHEVMEVTAGHRVTLTYNLYYSWVGETDRGVHLPHQLPLYNIVRDMLQEPTFLRNGGLIGFFCHHQYAHAHGSGRKSLPHAFKGVDLAVYSVFHSLRLKVGVHPIIKNKSGQMGGMSMRELMHDTHYAAQGDHVELFLQDLEKRPGTGDEDSEDYDSDEEEEFTTNVGTSLHGPTFDCVENRSGQPVTQAWPHQKVPKIVWMNDPSHKDFAHAGLAYGNQAELNYQFSAAAIIVVVPPSSARMMNPPPTTGAEVLDAGEPPSLEEVHPGRLLDTSMIVSDDDTSEETATFGSPPPVIDLT
ncbi:MAG: hypothetical protein Q9193_004919, partial [Seirophora villosa]